MISFPKRILVRGVNWLGDALMSTPTLQRLREAAPDSEITLLTQAKLADLFQHYPHIDEVMTSHPTEGIFALARRIRERRFDLALILPNSHRSALEAFLARIPERVGYGRRWLLTRSLPKVAITTRKKSVAEIKQLVAQNAHGRQTFPVEAHHVYNYLRLIGAPWTPPQLHVTNDEVVRAKRRLPNPGPWLGLNPGAEYGPAKRWPIERFIEAANRLHKKLNCGWILFGGPSDAPLTAQIAAACASAVDLAGKTTLRELCALFRCCKAVLTNDTGPMHLAAAVGVPVIVPFGSTSPELTGPQRGALVGDVPCAPCFRRECPIDFRCMRSIEVDQVVQETLKVCS
jgi:heptosyltransferase-2